MDDQSNKTVKMKVEDLFKSVPMRCSSCGKVYDIKKLPVTEGEEITPGEGICPECEKRSSEEENTSSKPERMGTMVLKNIDAMPKTIPIVCSWCGEIYHLKQWKLQEGRRSGISHGICPECEAQQRAELEKLKRGK